MAADRVLETDTIGTSGLYIAPVPGPPLTTRRRRGGRGREAHTIRIQEAATTPKSHFLADRDGRCTELWEPDFLIG